MKVLATFLLTLLFLTDPTLVGKVNTMKSEAKKAYLKNDFKAAVKTYRYLVDSLQIREDEVMLNLASAYYNLKDTANALRQYQSLTQSPKNYLRSKAQQQLGLIADQQGKPEEALNHFKQAIKSDLSNNEARYNYELLKKKLEEKKKQDQNKNKDDKKPEPSEFAKRLKAQADALSAQFRFTEANRLMTDGAKKDATVEPNYQDMMVRLKEIVDINGNK